VKEGALVHAIFVQVEHVSHVLGLAREAYVVLLARLLVVLAVLQI
jgi:hypothetical protein